MFVLCHVYYGYVKLIKVDRSGMFLEFADDPSSAICFDLKTDVYAVLSGFSAFDVDVDLLEIHKILN